MALFDFQSGGWRPLAELDDPLLGSPGLLARWCRHCSFPRHFFDTVASRRLERARTCRWSATLPVRLSHAGPSSQVVPRWTRKGWMLTRWRVGQQPLDLVNVHLFHDESNLRAL